MKRFVTIFCATGISAGIVLSSVASSLAAPVLPSSLTQPSNVVNVQHKRPSQHSNNRKPRPPQHSNNHKPRPPQNNAHRPRPPQHSHKPSRPGYWNGHNGYQHSRPGYRRHSDGWWYPIAAFALGAAIVGATTPKQPARPTMSQAHINWCANKYRSYRAYDNSFQPYNGPRKLCYSPYS
ncbi:BA14K family protein [Paenochrobactrum sp. BZR 588]|uniref:BA14K family protein n=1 Tax=Paenochrobactrum TaxID=999488 RepID=UPI0035BBA5EF